MPLKIKVIKLILLLPLVCEIEHSFKGTVQEWVYLLILVTVQHGFNMVKEKVDSRRLCVSL